MFVAIHESHDPNHLEYANFLAKLDPTRGTELDIALRDPRGDIYRLGGLVAVEEAILDQVPLSLPDAERLRIHERRGFRTIIRSLGVCASGVAGITVGPDVAAACAEGMSFLSRYVFQPFANQ